MNIYSTILIMIAMFVVLAIVAFIVFRKKANIEIKGPGNIGVKIDATNESYVTSPTPAVKIEDAKSSQGGVLAEDSTGRGVEVKRIDVKDDIIVNSSTSKDSPKV